MRDMEKLLGEDLLWRVRHGRILLKGRWIHFPLKPVDLLLRLPPSFALSIVKDLALKPFKRHAGGEDTFEIHPAPESGSDDLRGVLLPVRAEALGHRTEGPGRDGCAASCLGQLDRQDPQECCRPDPGPQVPDCRAVLLSPARLWPDFAPLRRGGPGAGGRVSHAGARLRHRNRRPPCHRRPLRKGRPGAADPCRSGLVHAAREPAGSLPPARAADGGRPSGARDDLPRHDPHLPDPRAGPVQSGRCLLLPRIDHSHLANVRAQELHRHIRAARAGPSSAPSCRRTPASRSGT